MYISDEKIHCIFQSEIFVIEDCEYYSPTTYTTVTTGIDKALTTPNKVKITFDVTLGQSNSGAYIVCGDDGNNYLGIGLIGSRTYGFIVQHNGSRVTNQTLSNLGYGTFPLEFIYNNGDMTCRINNYTLTYTYIQPLTKLREIQAWNYGSISNFKIKPL